VGDSTMTKVDMASFYIWMAAQLECLIYRV
jgi:hypothetical protein